MYPDRNLETGEALGTMSAHYSVKSILHTTATSCLAVVCLVGACSAGIISAQVDVYDLRVRGLMGALASNANDIQVTDQEAHHNSTVVAWINVDGTHISYPVAQPTSTMADDYYLHHAIDGNWRTDTNKTRSISSAMPHGAPLRMARSIEPQSSNRSVRSAFPHRTKRYSGFPLHPLKI